MTELIMGGIEMNDTLNYDELKQQVKGIELERDYTYQDKLTPKLDYQSKNIELSIDQNFLNEVLLWKVNRYAEFPSDVIEALNELKHTNDPKLEEKLLKEVLKQLLAIKGVQLPMASTILRFTNPERFAIYDQRVGRIINELNTIGSISDLISEEKKIIKIEDTIKFYEKYLIKLRHISSKLGIPFPYSDRILYLADKKFKGKLKANKSD